MTHETLKETEKNWEMYSDYGKQCSDEKLEIGRAHV